jgi:methylthioxylose transferase
METRPGLARFVLDHLPESVEQGFRLISQFDRLPQADRAAIALTAALTWLACAATVVPLYLLARASLPAPAAWAAAALWPLVPSAILFQPVADTAFPFLATTALALAAHAVRSAPGRDLLLATLVGVVLAVGMTFTLAFLAVGLIVASVLATAPGVGPLRRALRIAATGAGFLAPTLASWAITRADPFVIWWWNQKNHARFYVEFPRSYRAWVVANPIELAVALGLPATVWALVGLGSIRQAPRVAWATLAVLTILTLSGGNLGEVARIWLPLMPPLLTASGLGLTRLGGGPKTLAATLALLGAETLTLQATIQVVYPV